jgi:chorismate mutase
VAQAALADGSVRMAKVRLRALRGATTVTENEAGAILEATEELVSAVLERNRLAPADLVSCIFTCTEDLDAEFPAVAARRIGLNQVPLLCAREIPVPGALPRVIRLMLHCYPADDVEPQHVYLREAVALRGDLQGAQ